MKLHCGLKAFAILLLLLVSAEYLPASPLCVPDRLNLKLLKGRVVDSNDRPFPNAIVEIRDYRNDRRVIKRVVADENGVFDLGKVKAGKYIVYAEALEQITYFYFPVKLSRSGKLSATEPELIITLGFGMSGCRGSSAKYGDQST